MSILLYSESTEKPTTSAPAARKASAFSEKACYEIEYRLEN